MKRKFFLFLSILVLILSFLLLTSASREIGVFNSVNDDYIINLKKDLASLMLAYPRYITDFEVLDINNVYLILNSGEKILYDDGREKSYEEKLANPDIQDMLEVLYKFGPVEGLVPVNYNPGRTRLYPLMKEIYGSNQYEIEQNLEGISINSMNYSFNGNNFANYYLKSAIKELNSLAMDNPELWSFIYPLGGTYNFRYISRTNRLSPRAFGIAIDLASHKDDYWQWTTRQAGEDRLKSYPQAIVEVMEKNYFIWGGKWGQFDILHFEYRPEIIIKAKYFSDEIDVLWYENLPLDDRYVSEIVDLIEDKLN